MRTSYTILVTLGLGGGLGLGCTDHGAAKLTKIKDQVCACTTASCAEQAMQYADKIGAAANHRNQATARQMMDCLARLEAADRPSTDPDAEAGAGSADGAGSASAGSAATGSN
ncbi:MAG TPA: hypothetical protein VFP84_34275 [Kofleriaceae bacterium]|nr:hypothetical protein [Kofleriaceae bacterium]